MIKYETKFYEIDEAFYRTLKHKHDEKGFEIGISLMRDGIDGFYNHFDAVIEYIIHGGLFRYASDGECKYYMLEDDPFFVYIGDKIGISE